MRLPGSFNFPLTISINVVLDDQIIGSVWSEIVTAVNRSEQVRRAIGKAIDDAGIPSLLGRTVGGVVSGGLTPSNKDKSRKVVDDRIIETDR